LLLLLLLVEITMLLLLVEIVREPIVQETSRAPGPVWTGAENLASTVIRSPDRSARTYRSTDYAIPAHYIHF